MQILRNLVWWMVGLVYVVAFWVAVLLGQLFGSATKPIPTAALAVVAVCFVLGLLNSTALLQSGDTFTHEVGHAQIAALLFRKVGFIHTRRDSTGVTHFAGGGPAQRLGAGLISAGGPVASAMLFVFTTRLTTLGLTSYWLAFISIAAAAITITTLRNVWGFLVGIAIAGAFGYLWREGYGLQLVAVPLSDVPTQVYFTMVLVSGISAFNCGVALRYSWRVKNRGVPQSDEYRFGKAFFLGATLGGFVLVVFELVLIALGFTFLLGYDSPLALFGGSL